MKVFALAASMRKESVNRRLLGVATDMARAAGAEIDAAEFRGFAMPLYDGDLEAASGVPAAAHRLGERIAASDAWILASPEYNWSIPGTLKNAIDWLSRIRPVPLDGKSVLLLSASPGLGGGFRGLTALRAPLEGLGCWCYPRQFALPRAPRAWDDDGALKDSALADSLATMVGDYLSAARALAAR